MADLKVQRIPAPIGWNSETALDSMGDHAPRLLNMLPRAGQVCMRGPVWQTGPTVTGTNDSIIRGRMVRHTPAASEMILDVEGEDTGAYHVNLLTGAVTSLAPLAANKSPLRRYALVGTRVWAGTDPAPAGNMIYWDGGAVAPTVAPAATCPQGITDLIYHAERLFVITEYSAAIGAGSGGGPNTVVYTNPGGPSTVPVATDWTDPVSGLINQLVVGGPQDDLLTAFGRAGRDLVIFKKRGTWILSGSGSSNFTLRQVSDRVGCIDANSVVNINDGCFFLSDRGYHWFDGGQMTEVSLPIAATMRDALRRNVARSFEPPTGYTRLPAGYETVIDAAYVSNNYLALTILRSNATAPLSPSVDFSGLYDIARGAWIELSSGAFGIVNQPLQFLAVGERRLVWTGRGLVYIDDITDPGMFDGTDLALDGTIVPITAIVRTRLARLGLPTNKSQLHRVLVDYAARDTTATARLLDRNGTVLSSTVLPATGPASIGRASVDAFNEVDEAQLELVLDGTDTSTVSAAFYGVAFEYQTTHQRSSS